MCVLNRLREKEKKKNPTGFGQGKVALPNKVKGLCHTSKLLSDNNFLKLKTSVQVLSRRATVSTAEAGSV